ncbi:hypothetical protein SUGI_0596940 [Cryptomeria japonica]|nr:hypothetical protein SUGI_0596940 [Cryptomeria japonica]
MVKHIELECRCADETPEQQISFLLRLESEEDSTTSLNIPGKDRWAGGHVHDGDIYEEFLLLCVQILGVSLQGVRIPDQYAC